VVFQQSQVDLQRDTMNRIATIDTNIATIAASTGGGVSYSLRLDEASGTVTYVGEAVPGTATSAAGWRIKKLDSASGLVIGYADSVTTFSKVWDDRSSYVYG
jgi:hypothetical protein